MMRFSEIIYLVEEQLLLELTKREKDVKKKILPSLAMATNWNRVKENHKNALIKAIINIHGTPKNPTIEQSHFAVDYLSTRPRISANFTWEEIHALSRNWHEALLSKEEGEMKLEIDPSRIVYKKGPYFIYKLASKEECEYEGERIGHCVGQYGSAVESGATEIYSLRDKEEKKPITTIEIRENIVGQIYGDGPKTGNAKPSPERRKIIDNWLSKYYTSFSEEKQIELLKKKGGIIKFIKDPSEVLQITAVKESPGAIQFIKNPTKGAEMVYLMRTSPEI